MHPKTPLFFLAMAITACASKPVPSDIVDSWTQRAEERGKLQLARVTEVVEIPIDLDRRSSEIERMTLSIVIGPIAADAIDPLINSSLSRGRAYRHTFRLDNGVDKHMNLDFQYKLGECIAFRPGFAQDDVFPVRALAGECV